MSVRRAGVEEAALVRDLVRDAYAKWVPVIGREPLPMTVDYAVAVERNRIDLLLAAGRVVGLIETILQPDHVYIENIAVAPGAQGQGYGRWLLAHAQTIADTAGLAEIRLLTNAAFAANVALYERCGYRVTQTAPFMGGTTVYMTRRFDSGSGSVMHAKTAGMAG